MRCALLLAILALGCRRSSVEVRPDDKRVDAGRVACTFSEKIAPRCDVSVDKIVQLHTGMSLEIGAGARLTFAKGAGLVIDGGTLRARGTAEEPIVFTATTKSPGEWTGVVFFPRPTELSPTLHPNADAAPLPGPTESTLEHVVIEYGGARPDGLPPYQKDSAGLLVMPFVDDTVAVSNVTLRSNAGLALAIARMGSVTRLDGLHADGPVQVPLGLADAVGSAVPDPVSIVDGSEKSITLAKRTYVFLGAVAIRARTSSPNTLTIPAGATIKFAKAARLSIDGSGATAKLVANGVVFTSNETTPVAGDWHGLSFGGDVAAEIDGSTFEHAGWPVIDLPRDETKLRIVNNTFKSHVGAVFEAWKDCKPWEDPARGNSTTVKLCMTIPSPPAPMKAPVKALILKEPEAVEMKDLEDPVGGVVGGVAGGVVGGMPPPPLKKP